MCLKNQRKPTKKEQKTITKAYKTIVTIKPNLRESANTFCKYSPTKWNEMEPPIVKDVAGFHAFRNLTDAINDQTSSESIYEVQIKDIIAIGTQSPFNTAFTEPAQKDNALRAKYMKIGKLIKPSRYLMQNTFSRNLN